ncbi:unnamed protein product, partial [marine sediment metagenome]
QLLFCLSESVVQAHTEMLVETHAPIGLMTALWTVVLLAIVVYVVMAHFFERFDRQGTLAAKESMRQTQELLRTRDAVIFGLAKLADSRDSDTGEHLERIAAYSTALASELRRYSRYLNEITPAFVKLIGISSALHDIGKVGIEDGILLKPGPLTPEEQTRMQDHTIIGGRCLRGIEQHLGSSNFLQMAGKIAFAHHERWDGKGYPYGLAGTEIPLSARIVAIADVYDALATERCYKNVLPHEECVAIIRDHAGTQFDPHLVEVWLGIESRFRDIARQYPAARQARGSREDRLAEPAVEEKHDQHPVPSAAVSN